MFPKIEVIDCPAPVRKIIFGYHGVFIFTTICIGESKGQLLIEDKNLSIFDIKEGEFYYSNNYTVKHTYERSFNKTPYKQTRPNCYSQRFIYAIGRKFVPYNQINDLELTIRNAYIETKSDIITNSKD